jgi:hypothetical protein
VTRKEFEPKNPIIGILVVIIGSIIFFVSNPPWDTPGSLSAIHSVLGLLAVVTTSVTMIRVRMDPSPAHRMLLSAMGFMTILHFGSALVHLYFSESAVAHTAPHGIFIDIVEMAIIAILILMSAYLNQVNLKENSIWFNKKTPFSFLVGCFALYAFCFYLSEAISPESLFLILGYLFGGIALVAYSLSVIFFQKQPVGKFSHNPQRLMISCVILAISTLVLLVILPAPSSLWLLTISLQAGALIFIILATAYPFLVDVGIEPRMAYAYVISLLAFSLLPFVISQYFEETVPIIYVRDLGATLLIHFGSSILFGVMAYLLYVASRKGLSWHYDPIIISLFSWSIAELFVVLSHFLPFYEGVESFVPYVTGSFIAAVLQTVAIHWILNPSEKERIPISFKTILLSLSLTVIAIGAGEIIRLQLISGIPGLIETNWGEIIMLTISYIMAFNMVNFLMLMTTKKGATASMEFITTGSQCLWIISLILKANYSDWTAGWWAAEIVILVGVVGLPFVLTYLYSKEAKESQTLVDRTILYAEFIAKDVESHLQEALDSTSNLSMDTALSDSKLDRVSTILTNISQADELTRNIGALLKEDRFAPENLEAIDLVDSVNFAFHRVVTTTYEKYIELRFEYETGKYFVKANGLLVILFYNLFDSIFKRITSYSSFNILIHTLPEQETRYQLEITFQMPLEELIQNHDLFKRYLEGERLIPLEFGLVKRLLQLFGGNVYVQDLELQNASSEIRILIDLPATEESAY